LGFYKTLYISRISYATQVYEHACEADEDRLETYGDKRVKPSWEMPGFRSSNKWKLKELQFDNFRPNLDHHISFISSVMDRAPNLKTVLITEDEEACKGCNALAMLPPPIGGLFPRDKDEQAAIVKQLRDRVCQSAAQIIFRNNCSAVVF
jgi:hypothetical protein